jgi:predicted transcriptional regulator
LEESVRREKLRDLDDILDALEQLNLRDASALPEVLRARLKDFGVDTPSKANVTHLIEQVWEIQEQFLSSPVQGADSPRSASMRPPRDR